MPTHTMNTINIPTILLGMAVNRTAMRTVHGPLVHAHAHYPDVHHRHPH